MIKYFPLIITIIIYITSAYIIYVYERHDLLIYLFLYCLLIIVILSMIKYFMYKNLEDGK